MCLIFQRSSHHEEEHKQTLEEKLKELQIIGGNSCGPPLIGSSSSSNGSNKKGGRRISSSSSTWASRGPTSDQRNSQSFLSVRGSSLPLRPNKSVPVMARTSLTTAPIGYLRGVKIGRVASAPSSFQDMIGEQPAEASGSDLKNRSKQDFNNDGNVKFHLESTKEG